jgi:SAM-dependent methyltransferase
VNSELLKLLRCPKTGQHLILEDFPVNVANIENGWLISADGQLRYPVIGGIPRFVPESNYSDNFGMQWNFFRKTQLDSYSGHPITRERFWQATGWNAETLNDQWLLDVGCGAGRFAEVALQAGAKVVALDYSSAVDACYENLKDYPNLHVVQGDIYKLPFAPESFQFVYSLGVLQHTPDVEKAFFALPLMLRPGGHLCTDFYWKRMKTILHAKYLFRPLTKRIDQKKLFMYLQSWVPALLRLSQLLGQVPFVGRGLKRIVPVADYTGRFPLSDQQLKEWALLDTFDMLAPIYDNPQSVTTVRRWYKLAGLVDIEVGHWSHLVGRGIKPASTQENREVSNE